MLKKILLIEDETNITELVRYNLTQEGYHFMAAATGPAGIQEALKNKPDLILLDLMLPEMDGLEVCKRLKQNPATSAIPIIMLSAKINSDDKVVGLELGADDYIAKPFSPRELVARIKAIFRQTSQKSTATLLTAGTLQMDPSKHTVSLKGKDLSLSFKEYQLLKLFMESQGRVLSRDQIRDQVWGYAGPASLNPGALDTHISNLRTKLGTEAGRLLTVKGLGYRFEMEIDSVD